MMPATTLGMVFNQQSESVSEQVTGVDNFFEKLEIENSGNIDENQRNLNSNKTDTMKFAFNVISLVLFTGFVMSLLIPSKKKRKKTSKGSDNFFPI